MKYREQLKSIMLASGWTQEQLAQSLKVSFATLNSWINARSTPRAKAIIAIEKLYLDTVGVESVNAEALQAIKKESLYLKISPERIADNKDLLDKYFPEEIALLKERNLIEEVEVENNEG